MQQLLSLTNNKTMNKNFDLVKILKNAPRGTKLWSPLCGVCKLIGVRDNNDYPILCKANDGCNINFTNLGKFYKVICKDGECILFPSKDNRDWSTFRVSEHKSFEPFQKVLVLSGASGTWLPDIYRYYNVEYNAHECLNYYRISDNDIIPYEGNEDLVGKPAK